MIDRHSVLDYLNKHPSHTTWQMRLHFLQASRQLDRQSPVCISAIANQLNYILRDLEATGKIPPRPELSVMTQDSHRGEELRIEKGSY
jgi:hypothetical protein